jgi:hypothetical protein
MTDGAISNNTRDPAAYSLRRVPNYLATILQRE